MSLLSRLAEKSWQRPGLHGAVPPEDYRPAAAMVGLWVYLGVAAVLFSLIAAAYLVRMGVPGGMGGTMEHGSGADWRAMPEPPLLWFNTAVLAASSLAWELARRTANDPARMRRRALAGAGLGLLFLAGQLALWQHYLAQGYYLAANPANAFFYLLTGLHGLHLAGGLIACARVVEQSGDGRDPRRAVRNIGLCALYWHFLLLVWIVLAGLLLLT